MYFCSHFSEQRTAVFLEVSLVYYHSKVDTASMVWGARLLIVFCFYFLTHSIPNLNAGAAGRSHSFSAVCMPYRTPIVDFFVLSPIL